MRTVSFHSVLVGTAKMLGLQTERDLTPARASTLTEYITNRVKEGWEFDFWPEWTVYEERQYRENWSPTAYYDTGLDCAQEVAWATSGGLQYVQALQTSGGAIGAQIPFDPVTGNINGAYWALSAGDYTTDVYQPGAAYTGGTWGQAGTQVWDPFTGAFWQCIVSHVGGPNMNYAYFGRLWPFDRYVAFCQPNQTLIGRVKDVYLRNPLIATRNPGRIPFRLSDRGVQVNIRAPATVVVGFSYREPVFTTCVWDGSYAYQGIGELVYFPRWIGGDGNCYKSTEASVNVFPQESSFWEVQPMPLVLSNFVKRAALADALRDLKQTDRAVAEEGRAYDELASAQEREIQAQGGSERVMAETYGGGL